MPRKKTLTTRESSSSQEKALDLLQPLWVVMHQTEAKTYYEAFQGPDAEAHAKARASQKASRAGTVVAVLGPQIAAYQPPRKVEAEEVQLDFLKEPAE